MNLNFLMMKKITLLFSVFILVAASVQAQTEKGTLLLGGNLSYNNVEDNSSFTASPNVGVFVANNFAVGAQFDLYTSDGFTSWSVGPFARYYFGKSASGKPFLGASVNVGGSDNSETEVGFGAHGGYALFLNRSVALEFGLRYNRFADMDMIGVGAGFQIHFRK